MNKPLTDKEKDAIWERLLNPHAFAPYGEARGMVSENVRDEDFAPDPCVNCEGSGIAPAPTSRCHYCAGSGKGGAW